MDRWRTAIRLTSREVKMVVTEESGDELMRARFPVHVEHPRALLTFLEGIALWSGSPVTAVISVADRRLSGSDLDLFGGVLFPAESALVHFELVEVLKPRRLRGLGSFREVLRLTGLEPGR